MRNISLYFLPAALMSVGCTTVQDSFSEHLSASGINVVSADMDSGAVAYTGQPTDSFIIDGRSWGMATKAERADERQDGNTYSMGLSSGALVLTSS